MTEQYHVKITGPGINVERDLPEALAQQLLVAALTGDAREIGQPAISQRSGSASAHAGAAVRTGGGVEPEHGDSIANYIEAAAAQENRHKIAAIASFLKKHRAKATFTQAELEQGFEDAADKVPRNLSRDIKKAIRAGWIAGKSGEKGVYYVTGAGTQAVGTKFEGHRRTRTKRAKKAAKKATKS